MDPNIFTISPPLLGEASPPNNNKENAPELKKENTVELTGLVFPPEDEDENKDENEQDEDKNEQGEDGNDDGEYVAIDIPIQDISKVETGPSIIKNIESFWEFIDGKLDWDNGNIGDKRLLIVDKLNSADRKKFLEFLDQEVKSLDQFLTLKKVFDEVNETTKKEILSHIIAKGSVYTVMVKEDPEFLQPIIGDKSYQSLYKIFQ